MEQWSHRISVLLSVLIRSFHALPPSLLYLSISVSISLPCEDTAGGSCLQAKKGGIGWHLDLGLPSLYVCEKINACCWSHPVCGISLWQPEATNTVINPGSSLAEKIIVCIPPGQVWLWLAHIPPHCPTHSPRNSVLWQLSLSLPTSVDSGVESTPSEQHGWSEGKSGFPTAKSGCHHHKGWQTVSVKSSAIWKNFTPLNDQS